MPINLNTMEQKDDIQLHFFVLNVMIIDKLIREATVYFVFQSEVGRVLICLLISQSLSLTEPKYSINFTFD